MKSTGEVMGIARDFPTAFGKAQAAAGVDLPESGAVFITVTDTDKPAATQLAARLHDLGFEIVATGGTALAIERMGVPVSRINKLGEGSPNVLDLIRKGRCDFVINTPTGSSARADGYEIRTAAVREGIPCVTTMTGATAAVRAISAGRAIDSDVRSIQEIHIKRPPPLLSRDRRGVNERSGPASPSGGGRRRSPPPSAAAAAWSPRTGPRVATGSSRCSTARGPHPSPAASTCWRRPPAGTGGRSCRARSRSPRSARAATASASASCSTTSAPVPSGCVASPPARSCG